MYIGVDLGTSAVKLLLMDGDGTIIKTVSKEYPIFFPQDGWSEQNPSDWLKQSIAGIREIFFENLPDFSFIEIEDEQVSFTEAVSFLKMLSTKEKK